MNRALERVRSRPGATMTFYLGRILQVIGMLTLGVALFVYGFGEENMTAELLSLMIGSLVFLGGRLIERQGRGTR
jgi:hypothetical protein